MTYEAPEPRKIFGFLMTYYGLAWGKLFPAKWFFECKGLRKRIADFILSQYAWHRNPYWGA